MLISVGGKNSALGIGIYEISLYSAEGLFISAVLLFFWSLRIAYRIGQVSSSDQILLLSQGSKTKQLVQRKYACNISVVIVTAIVYYVFCILYATKQIHGPTSSTIFFSLNTAIMVIIFISILVYALKYAGNPASKEIYKIMIYKTRYLIIIWGFARIVFFVLLTL
jgi:hypothetical protein